MMHASLAAWVPTVETRMRTPHAPQDIAISGASLSFFAIQTGCLVWALPCQVFLLMWLWSNKRVRGLDLAGRADELGAAAGRAGCRRALQRYMARSPLAVCEPPVVAHLASCCRLPARSRR